jgi:uncharacterized protein
MSRRIESLFVNGPAGRIEALLEEPEDRDPIEAALVCHPHPQYGGTMHNKVVHRVARGLRRAGSVVLRFNYRGVNLSEGKYDNGVGEVEDARSALSLLLVPLSATAVHTGGILVRFARGSETRVPASGRAARDRGRISDPDARYIVRQGCDVPRIFVQSTNDEFGPLDEWRPFIEGCPSRSRSLPSRPRSFLRRRSYRTRRSHSHARLKPTAAGIRIQTAHAPKCGVSLSVWLLMRNGSGAASNDVAGRTVRPAGESRLRSRRDRDGDAVLGSRVSRVERRRDRYRANQPGLPAQSKRGIRGGAEDATWKSAVFKRSCSAVSCRTCDAHFAKGRPGGGVLRTQRSRRLLHYAVVAGVDDRSVMLNDPARGKFVREDLAVVSSKVEGDGNWALLAVPRKGQ